MNAGRLSHEAKRVGMFLLITGTRYEFLSRRTGKSVVTWFRDSRRWTSVFGQGGEARNAYVALEAAIKIDNERNQP